MSAETNNDRLSTDILAEEYFVALQQAYRSMREMFLKKRDSMHVTQQTIADRLCWNKALVSRRLHGQDNLTFKTMSALATAMDCRLSVDFVPYEEMAVANYRYDDKTRETSTVQQSNKKNQYETPKSETPRGSASIFEMKRLAA